MADAPTHKRVDAGKGAKRKRYRGNAMMIEKIETCIQQAAVSVAKKERDEFRAKIGVTGMERRGAAQAKRERKAAKARELMVRQAWSQS